VVSRQTVVLRAYDHLKDKNEQFPAGIAIELPTGTARPSSLMSSCPGWVSEQGPIQGRWRRQTMAV
jgi:hypothetical protein